jgi:hypothetical protein
MASIRAVRRRFDANGDIYFIDDGRNRDGSTYFALFQLAPRRLRRFPQLDHLAEQKFGGWLPRRLRTVLVVPNEGQPVQLVPGTSIRPGSGLARQARP